MTNTFFAADHHFDQPSILTFKDYNGCPIREFRDVDHMHEVIIESHNSVVKPNDRVYFVGDVSMKEKGLSFVKQMNGKKVLIKGNHDIFKISSYLDVFEDVRSFKVYPQQGLICSHIPLHPGQFQKGSRWKGNIHGHLHANLVRLPLLSYEHEAVVQKGGDTLLPDNIVYHHTSPVDTRYLNVSVEQINYTPIDFDEVLEYFNIDKNIGQYRKDN